MAHHTRTVPDLCISEYAKKTTPWKYYYDKLKTVVASYIRLREHIITHANLNFEEAKKFILPFVICEGLEADIYTIQVASEDWCVVEKYGDIDLPSCVEDVKDGGIAVYIKNLKQFKVFKRRHNV